MPTILVTGASRGIGQAIATALRARGVRVIRHSTQPLDGDGIAADLSDPPAPHAVWERALEHAGSDRRTGQQRGRIRRQPDRVL